MRIVRAGLRPAVGFVVIAHGLAHSVMPMRGLMDPAGRDWGMPYLFYVIVVVGFTLAGLGLLGVRRLDPAIRPALVLASAYSLIPLSVMGVSGFWWGRTLDVILLLTGLTGIHRFLPQPAVEASGARSVFRAIATAAAIYGAVAVATWPAHRGWGSQRAEHMMSLPGDDLARNRAIEAQRAVTIDAPPEVVQALIDRDLRGHRAFVLAAGDGKTRFIIRATVGNERMPPWLAALDMMAYEMPHFIMERRMMLQIKSRAEANAKRS